MPQPARPLHFAAFVMNTTARRISTLDHASKGRIAWNSLPEGRDQ
jgi:hypothetical protein